LAYNLSLRKGASELELEVLKKGLCTGCGGCIGICPYLRVRKENVVLLEPCGKTEGRCYELCPRTRLDFEALNQQVFGKPREDFLLGTHQSVLLAQSAKTAVQKKAQYGGAVTGLLLFALSKKLIDGAILVNYSDSYKLLPEPVLARTEQEIIACAGSKYTAAPSLKILNSSLEKCRKLAFVGRACQVEALRNRIRIEPEVGQKIALIIGLFCMWALDYRKLYAHLAKQIEIDKAKKFDIPYNRFVVHLEKGKRELEFEPIKGFRRSTCDLCYDFTSEFADVSVGSTEWKDDWNTLITRTDRGAKLVEQAGKGRALKVKPLPEDRVNLLRNAVLGKKQRVLKAVFEDKSAPEYLVLSDQEKNFVKGSKPISGVKK
jgi:coenzyme F420 hydrogenase subunit beta